jgi:hypothetical protein
VELLKRIKEAEKQQGGEKGLDTLLVERQALEKRERPSEP